VKVVAARLRSKELELVASQLLVSVIRPPAPLLTRVPLVLDTFNPSSSKSYPKCIFPGWLASHLFCLATIIGAIRRSLVLFQVVTLELLMPLALL